LARVFALAQEEALSLSARPPAPEPEALHRLDRRARIVLGLFANAERVTSAGVAQALSLSERMARRLLQGWVADGWLVVVDPSRRKRAYTLLAHYRPFIGPPTATQRTA